MKNTAMNVKRPVSKALVVMALSLVGFVGSASAATIPITNGSFEQGTLTDPFTTVVATDSTAITGWTVSAGSVDYIGNYWQADDGTRSLDMSGNGAGTIEQQIFVQQAGNVTVNFAMAGNTDGPPLVKSLRVSLTGPVGSQVFVFDTTGQSHANMGWVDYAAEFSILAAGNYTLAFQSLDNTAFGPALDNISASVPDGGMTATLLGLALTGLGLFRRKRA